MGTKQGAQIIHDAFARIGVALTIVALSALGASAQSKKYGSVGWDIFVNDSMGPGCLIARKLSPDVQLRMGIDATRKIGYMALYAKADANVSAG